MLAEEMEAVKFLIPESRYNKPVDILCHIGSAEFPNFYIALRTLLTIPITVASGERSLSKLKLIKTYLRSSIWGRSDLITWQFCPSSMKSHVI